MLQNGGHARYLNLLLTAMLQYGYYFNLNATLERGG